MGRAAEAGVQLLLPLPRWAYDKVLALEDRLLFWRTERSVLFGTGSFPLSPSIQKPKPVEFPTKCGGSPKTGSPGVANSPASPCQASSNLALEV